MKRGKRMPKMKTHRGTAKRVRVTGSGKFKRNHAFKSHILGKKSAKRKRNLRKSAIVADANVRNTKKLLPYL